MIIYASRKLKDIKESFNGEDKYNDTITKNIIEAATKELSKIFSGRYTLHHTIACSKNFISEIIITSNRKITSTYVAYVDKS